MGEAAKPFLFEGFQAGCHVVIPAACSCESCWERAAGGFGGFEGGQTAGLNALKNRCLRRVAARVAVERPAGGFGGFEGGQTAGLNAPKKQMPAACSCESCRGKPCGRV